MCIPLSESHSNPINYYFILKDKISSSISLLFYLFYANVTQIYSIVMVTFHPKLSKEKIATILTNFLLELGDAILINEDMEKLVSRLRKPIPRSNVKKSIHEFVSIGYRIS